MPPKAATRSRVVNRGVPDWICAVKDDYNAQISHVFAVHGNIYDFVDNAGNALNIQQVLASSFDDNINQALNPNGVTNHKEVGVQSSCRQSEKIRILTFYNTSGGLNFPDSKSKSQWKDAFKQVLGQTKMDELEEAQYFEPTSPDAAMALFNHWFTVSKKLLGDNKARREAGQPMQKELMLTLVLLDADTLVPRGDIANLGTDRGAIVHVRNWAQDVAIGDRNLIILMARHLTDIHDSILGELAVSHAVRKPDLVDRREWITNFDATMKRRVEALGIQSVGDNPNVRQIDFAPDFTLEEFALQSAGMNRRQLKDVILNSWRTAAPVDFPMVQERKKRALEDEYGGILDIKEGEFGFEQIGGHAHFKDYALWEVIKRLKAGDKKLCSRGALMIGPPGTGKTMLALALAKEAGLNFIEVDLGRVFGGLVGESEKNTRKLFEAIEAAAPCIVFLDEIDTVMASGRSGGGDSGTSARLMGGVMRWLSDPGRVGKVVVLAATNRPDLLDSAMIRDGRLDAKIPMLPPTKGDAAGRWAILAALTRKHKVVLADDLLATKSSQIGLGAMLLDTERYWTGAEIEGVLKSSLRRAARAERTADGKADLRIAVEDWMFACSHSTPTGDVEAQINLALEFAGGEYIPENWAALAKEVKERANEKKRRLAEAA